MKFLKIENDGVKIRFYLCGLKIWSTTDRRFKAMRRNSFREDFSSEGKRFIIERQFERKCGYKPNIDAPQTFNEKLQWLKLYYRDPLMTQCADKYRVREYIEKTIGPQYLVPLVGVWDKVDDIDWDALPDQFVLKTNWGTGQNIIVRDKSRLNISKVKRDLLRWMQPNSNHYFYSFEWAYKNIQPKIIAEEYIGASGKDLPDYKFMCFDGNPLVMFVVTNRFKNINVTFYDSTFERLPFSRLYSKSATPIAKPENFEKMLELSKALSKLFPFVRCDFYDANGKIYCGELTFYPGNGAEPFEPKEWDYKIGEMLKLPHASKSPDPDGCDFCAVSISVTN